MRNLAELPSLSNQTFSDRTAGEAIRNADRSPKFFPTKKRNSGISIAKSPSSTEPVTLFSTNPQSGMRENSQPNRGSILNQMTIDQLNQLSAQIQFQRKFKRAITDTDYSALMRAIDRERQWKKRKAKL